MVLQHSMALSPRIHVFLKIISIYLFPKNIASTRLAFLKKGITNKKCFFVKLNAKNWAFDVIIIERIRFRRQHDYMKTDVSKTTLESISITENSATYGQNAQTDKEIGEPNNKMKWNNILTKVEAS